MMKKRKMISWILVFIMVFELTPIVSVTMDVKADIISSGDYEYELSDEGAAITKYNGDESEVTIPDTLDGYKVVKISRGAFSQNLNVQKVIMPNSITYIGTGAFSGCSNLSEVTLSTTLETIEGMAFDSCAIESITIPKSLKNTTESWEYGGDGKYSIFKGCNNLTNVTLEAGMTELPNGLFANTTGITTVTIPDSVTKIKDSAFENCKGLEKITIPDSVKEICTNAFKGCSSMTEVSLSKNLESLGSTVFCDCTALTTVEIPKSLVNVATLTFIYDSKGTFSGCVNLKKASFEAGTTAVPACLFFKSYIEQVTIPDTVTKIGNEAFLHCENLQWVKIAEGSKLKNIGAGAFSYDTKLDSIDLPDTVTNIEVNAFAGCSSLSEIKLPNMIKQIDENAFLDCDKISSINIPKSIIDYSLDDSNWLKNYSIKLGKIFGKSEGVNDTLKKVSFEDGVTDLTYQVCSGLAGLENVEIPDSVTKIHDSAFYDCPNLKQIVIPDSVTSIGSSAFGKTGLTSVTIPDSVTEMSKSIFEECTQLSSVKLPAKLTTIPGRTFYGCSALKNIEFPDSVTEISESAFTNSGLESIVLSDNIRYVGEYAFRNCTSLSNITFGTGVNVINPYTFDSCNSLTNVTIPYSITAIRNNAFSNCDTLADVNIPGTTTDIDKTAFENSGKVTVTCPEGSYAETFVKEKGIDYVIKNVPAENVTVTPSDLTMDNETEEKITLTVTPSDFTDKVVWESSDSDIVEVDGTGRIKAQSPGNAIIKVSVGEKSARCNVTVLQPVKLISLKKNTLEMEADQSKQLNVDIYPSNATNKQVQWSSSDENVAAVDAEGNVTSVGKGTAIITVKTMDGSEISDTCTVTVTNDVIHADSVDKMESPHPYVNDCSDAWAYTIPGAELLKVVFDERTKVEGGFDYISVYDGSGKLYQKYTGEELSGGTIYIYGDTVKIKLESGSSGTDYGFKVASIEAVDPNISTDDPTEESTEERTTEEGTTEEQTEETSTEKSTGEETTTEKQPEKETTTDKQSEKETTTEKKPEKETTSAKQTEGETTSINKPEEETTTEKQSEKETTTGKQLEEETTKLVQKKTQSIKVTKSYTKTYGSKAFKLSVKRVKGNGKITYSSSNKKVATVSNSGKVTVKGTGICTITVKAATTDTYKGASAKINITVNPKKNTVSKVKVSNKTLTVTWKKDTKGAGYELQYSTAKSFSKKQTKTVDIKKTKTTSYNVKKLTEGKTYYVRVRTYQKVKVSGKTKKLYGGWSAVKSIKIKKKLQLSKTGIVIKKGNSTSIKVKGKSEAVKWESSNSDKVTVDNNGNIKALDKGTAKIAAKVGKEKLTCKVFVYLSDTGNEEIDNKVHDIIKKTIKADMSTAEKVKAIHDYMVLNCKYDYDNYLNGTIPDESYRAEGVILKKTAVCSGYAKAFKVFMDALNIPCEEISGTTEPGPHGWNLVKVDGNWYHMDVTWDDPVSDKKGEIWYDYFLIPDNVMDNDHEWDRNSYKKCDASSDKFISLIGEVSTSAESVAKKMYDGFVNNNGKVRIIVPKKYKRKCFAYGKNLKDLYGLSLSRSGYWDYYYGNYYIREFYVVKMVKSLF